MKIRLFSKIFFKKSLKSYSLPMPHHILTTWCLLSALWYLCHSFLILIFIFLSSHSIKIIIPHYLPKDHLISALSNDLPQDDLFVIVFPFIIFIVFSFNIFIIFYQNYDFFIISLDFCSQQWSPPWSCLHYHLIFWSLSSFHHIFIR